MSESNHAWREFDVCIPYAAISASKRHIQKRHEKFIVARGSRDSDIWSGTWSDGSQMSESNHAWCEFDVCIPYAAISASKRHIQKRHEKFIVARGSRDSDIWSGACRNGSQMSKSNHALFLCIGLSLLSRYWFCLSGYASPPALFAQQREDIFVGALKHKLIARIDDDDKT
jgi:hypothetical protein